MVAERKLLQIIQCTNLAGMERASSERIRGLRERFGVSARVLSPRLPGDGAFMFSQLDPAAQFYEYKGKFNLLGHSKFSAGVQEAAGDVDVICVTGTCASSMRAANSSGKPVVLDHHYHHGSTMASRLKWRAFYELLCRDVKGIAYVSPFIRSEAVAIAPWLDGRAHVVRQTIPVPFRSFSERKTRQAIARHKLGLPEDAFIVGNAGWLISRKRFDIFLNVAAEFKKRYSKAYFVICGNGELFDELNNQASSLGISESVLFSGWVPDVTDHFAAWDAMLFNTDFDANPRSPLEAVGAGLPLVASSKYGGLAEFFLEPGRGFFFSDHDVMKMAESLHILASDQEIYKSVQLKGIEYLRKEYDESAVLDDFRTLLFNK